MIEVMKNTQRGGLPVRVDNLTRGEPKESHPRDTRSILLAGNSLGGQVTQPLSSASHRRPWLAQAERRQLLSRSSYRERDYAFGQLMLQLRTSIGLTQARLAAHLGVSRQAVGEWEAGSSSPKAEHLKALIVLGIQQQAWALGREAQEIRALWRAAHPKELLDESWLQGLLSPPAAPREEVAGDQNRGTDTLSVPPASRERRHDIGEALDIPRFYGREEELALLSRWIGKERCRVVSVLGMGGIGKSALAVTVMQRVARQFEVVIWRSLRDAPSCDTLVEECLQVLAPQRLPDRADSLEGRLRRLLEQLRTRRVLLVLDNLEMLLEEGTGTGRMRAGFEGYTRLLQRIGEKAHQSCLLLTSREKPADLVPLEGSRAPVRALRLAGLDSHAGAQLLAEKDVAGSLHDRVRLVEVYRGNPLALKIVAQAIVDLFGGEIVPFLEQGEIVFGGVRELLEQQLLALLNQLRTRADNAQGYGPANLLALLREHWGHLRGLDLSRLALRGVSLQGVEMQGTNLSGVNLQNCVFTEPIDAIVAVAISRNGEYWAVGSWRGEVHLWGEAGRTLYRVWQAHIASVSALTFSPDGRTLTTVSWDSTIKLWDIVSGTLHWRGEQSRGIIDVAFAPDGYLLASSGGDALIQLWDPQSGTNVQTLAGQGSAAHSLAWSPDGRLLVSGHTDGSIWVWKPQEAESSIHARTHTGHTQWVTGLAFSPDGSQLASASWDRTIKLWEVESFDCLQTFSGHTDQVQSVVRSPDGRTLASCSYDLTIWLWDVKEGRSRAVLQGQTAVSYSIAFTPDSRALLSGSDNGTLRVWDVDSGQGLRMIGGYVLPSTISTGAKMARSWPVAARIRW